MNKVPDAWDDDWSNAADDQTQPPKESDSKRLTAKQTKAQKRAQQAEFNRQFWAEAEGPRDPNYFLESRNAVPLRQEFKPAPVLLSRKGPIVQKVRPSVEASFEDLKLKDKDESSEEEEESASKQKSLEAAKVQAAKDREEKQRKYEERRLELFGPSSQINNNNTTYTGRPVSRSGGSSPASLTPPGSRSSTPHRATRGRGGRRGNNLNTPNVQRVQQQHQLQQQQLREVYDPGYSAKPGSNFLMRREQGQASSVKEIQPIREPRAPDGTGVNGAGFLPRPIKYA